MFLVWFTSPYIWLHLSFSAYLIGETPTKLLYLLNDLPGRAWNLLSTGKNLIRNLNLDNVEVPLPIPIPESYLAKPWAQILVSEWCAAYGSECIPASDVPHLVPLDSCLSGYPSIVLVGILVDFFSRMADEPS
ncbi:hypothetical protein DSO57_1001476 [Entomophthora muscae]|uniref:Uncharacterized protein n=1 Tax=Entomophthora muscae TaxID=34485 RepID=A0ACC2UIY7_9FUNG|nr:hypothetical protein DSO57_1001476 [Entomophthora muscae]